MEFRLLGPVQAVSGQTPLRLGGPRQRALLALLLLEPGRPVPAERLAEELWHGRPPPGAETTLRSYVSRLRRALGGDAVSVEHGGYTLEAAREQVDTYRFERLLDEGREALARDAAGRAAERLQAALGLWRGRALADVAVAGLLAQEAQRLDELRLVCLEERIEADLALARHAPLVAELQALVAEHPLRERLRRQLVLALYRSGRQADALAAYRETRRLLDEELGLEPGEELRQLERAILRHDVGAVAPPVARHNLPAPATSFVGRERELDEVAAALRANRLVTLTGLGGSGKTRLALETAARQAEAWAEGVWLVDLTAVRDPRVVATAVAGALRVQDASELLHRLARRELLLVLDNCEHLVDACAELVQSLLAGCPDVRILATSRIPLNVLGELDYPVEPLTAEQGGVRLFLERARAVRRDLADDEATLAAAASICRELDGLPLAIELAAARVKVLSLDEILARLDDRFRFLRAWQRVTDPRHGGLETTMDWSYELLGPEEQRLLRRLAVFAGGGTLGAVADVCVDGDADAAVELLARLVDASLVRLETGAATRYLLLETVRQYAAARLAGDPDADAIRRRHAAHFLAVAEATNLAIEGAQRGPQDHELALREQHNLRAALDFAAETDVELALRLMLELENFWVTHALHEGAERYERLLPRTEGLDVVLRARATLDYGSCLDVLRLPEAAHAAYSRSRALYASVGDELNTAYLDYRIGIALNHWTGDMRAGKALWERSLEVFRRYGATAYELQVMGDLGWVEYGFGDAERGRTMLAESLAMGEQMGWDWWRVQAMAKLAGRALEHGRIDEAESWARTQLELCRRMSNRPFGVHALAVLARVAAARGDADRAARLWTAVEATEVGPGRFGAFDRDAFAAAIPDHPRPQPLAYAEAVAVALAG